MYSPFVVCIMRIRTSQLRQQEGRADLRRPSRGLFLLLLEAGLPVGEGIALLRAGFHQLVGARRQARFLEGHRNVMATVVLMVPGNADVLAAGTDDVVGVSVLLLVLDADDLDGCLDGEGIEFSRIAGFRGGEGSDDEC